MLNNIIDAISVKLKQEFGNQIAVYKEPVEQGEITPCFYVYLHTSNQKKLLGERYFTEQRFAIHYHPAAVNKNAAILDTIERLNSALEYISLASDLLHGTKMRCKIVNGILLFFVNYNLFVYREAAATDVMESIAIENGLKKE